MCGIRYEYEKSIEVLGVRVNQDGHIHWVSKAWTKISHEFSNGCLYPLVAPLSRGIFIYGGRENKNTFSTGVVIDAKSKSVT